MPRFIGMPSAPGNVPKYESNDRFSCMIITTCLILWIPVAAVDALVDPFDGGDPLDEQAVAKTTTTAAIPTNRADQERIRRTLRAASVWQGSGSTFVGCSKLKETRPTRNSMCLVK